MCFQAEISDATGAQWINVFRNEAEALLGITAEEFGNHKVNVRINPILIYLFECYLYFQQNESIIEDIVRKAINRERIFKLRVKAEQYNVNSFH